MIWNPPRQPQKNGVVERSQGTGKRWAEPKSCDSPEALQANLDEMDQMQREAYPYLGHPSRLACFPSLPHSGLPYSREMEGTQWDWERVALHVSQYCAVRKVDSSGVVWVCNHRYYVGSKYHGQEVFVSLDPISCEWIFRDAAGVQLRCREAKEMTAENILHFQNTPKENNQT